jgi:hypothetical protein
LSQEERKEIGALESIDPNLFEELLLKKQWQIVQRDPSKTVKDQDVDMSSYWPGFNALPESSVKLLVNKSILAADKKGCDYILNRIFTDKQHQDSKITIQSKERDFLRQKLRLRHEQQA